MTFWRRKPLSIYDLREKWREHTETTWSMYIQRDSDGMVHCAPLLSGMVSTWASEIMLRDEQDDHSYRADYTQRLRDER